MEKGKIFIVDEREDTLREMSEELFAAEIHLQELIAKYPNLLAGEQIDPDRPKKWLLIAREVQIPDEIGGSGRLSLDHLFVDQDSVPTFVECKRSTDTRTRREVVAQMIDYAANGTEYLPMKNVRDYAEETANDDGLTLEEVFGKAFGLQEAEEIETYWELVEENLRNGKVRLIFAADETPRELRRMVEFLNDKMADVEVLIVEIKQFTDQSGLKVLVPRVLGITEKARGGKTRRGKTTEAEFLEKCLPETREFYKRIIDDAKERKHYLSWGEVGFSMQVAFPSSGSKASIVFCYPSDTFRLSFAHFKNTDVPQEEIEKKRGEMEGLGIFDRGTEYSLTVNLEGKDTEIFFAVYKMMRDWVEELSNTH